MKRRGDLDADADRLSHRIDFVRGHREPRVRLPDPRSYGSGNPGATNVLRTGKKSAAALTLLGDGAKGWLAVVIASRFAEPASSEATMAAAAVAVVLGHMYPVFFRFQGGKGRVDRARRADRAEFISRAGTVATWLIIAAFFRISSLAALVAALFAPFFTLLLYNAAHPYFIGVAIIAALLSGATRRTSAICSRAPKGASEKKAALR